ncbi:carbohydrate ABC transporter permease [Paenibacillus methanolicus]|uniref:N-acetylglucosamine transport system permease protein n=1 Tax=Paenibacillus methanolicus TaxID=582686 RepID=A0A5S5BW73_9BACL|nr:carbohydrate ABC transporter permease [Paenibacillus methanolicus]TYP71234.1 N-acetylglucosamine transport system permease protein [Paenibacillus methanolicus]
MNQGIKNPIAKIIFLAILLLWSVSVIYPLIWTLLDSLKDNQQFFFNKPWALPNFPLLWENYSYVWEKYHFDKYFVNSLLVTGGATLLGLLLAAMTAYVLARFKFKGSGAIYGLYISSMMVPFILALIPLFFLLNSLHLTNTKIGLILVYTSSVLAFGIFVLVGFFKGLPKELEEAANIDGAGYYGTFFRVMLPLSQPGLIAVGIINVLNIWNEYIVGTVLVSDPEQYTLPIEIGVMQAEMQYRTEWGPLFAALMFTIVPVLILYIIFQRQIASGITAGAVK